MEQWKIVATMVFVFAFSLEIRPLDSFLTAYLTSYKVNVPLEEVSDVLVPFRLYCSVLSSLLVFLLTDYLRYKPVMMFNGLVGIFAYVSLIISPTIFGSKMIELGLSLFSCAELSYYGYLYAQISNREHYQRATGYIKAGTSSGICFSGILGQVLVYLHHNDYSSLPYYSIIGVTFATIWACFLPAVKSSTYFYLDDVKAEIFSEAVIHNPNIPKYNAEKAELQNVERMKLTHSFERIYNDFKHSYTNRMTLRWSCWYIIGMTGYMQVVLYMNVLYTYVTDASDNTLLFNGLVDSLATFCAAICSYNIGKLDADWIRYGDTFLMASSVVIGVPLILCCYLKNIIFIYVIYIIYITLMQTVLVIVISQIAIPLKNNCFTLVLGFNTFLSIILSSISSVFLVGIGVSIPRMFMVYGDMYIVLGISYGCAALFKNKTTQQL